MGATPAVLVKVAELAKDPDTDLGAIGELLRTDGSLAADIIRISNSPYYAPSEPHSNLTSAINQIGMGEVIRVVNLSMAQRLFARDLPGYGILAADYWSASIAAALVMEALAKQSGLNPEDAYTIGILHAVGRILINRAIDEKGFTLYWDGHQPIQEWERASVGFDYAEAGAMLFEHWRFPIAAETFARKFVHPEDAPLVFHELAKASLSSDPHFFSRVEVRVLRGDGELRHMLTHVGVRLGVNGQTEQIRGTVQDITERKKSEQELRKLWRAVEQTPTSVIITDFEGKIEYANPKFIAITGYSLQEVLGQNPRLLKSGHHPPSFYQAMWETLLQGNVWRGEVVNRRKNGETYWESSLISPITDDHGKITHFLAIKEDITEKKKNAEALRQAEQKLAENERWQKAILDNIPDLTLLKNREGKYLVVNRAWCEFAEKTISQVIEKTAAEIFRPEIAQKLQAQDELVMNSGQALQEEIQIEGGKNGTAWFELFKTALFDENGNIYGMAGIGRNITQRKLSEVALLESQHFLQSTLDALSAHIAILDEQGVIIAVNAAWNRFAQQNNFLGASYGIGVNYISLCEAAVGDCATEGSTVAKGIRKVVSGQTGEFSYEYPCHSPQEKRWFMVCVTRFKGKGPTRVVIAHENITARKQAEEELQWKTALMEAQVNSSIEGTLVVDWEGNKILQNQQMTNLHKIPAKIAAGKNEHHQINWIALHVLNREQFLERVYFLMSHPDVISREEIEMRDGTILDRYSSPLVGKDGKYYGRIWTFRDITESRRVAKQLSAAKESADAANRAKSDFLAMMSHDIRTPMNGLIGFANLLNDTPLSEQQREFVQTIQLSGQNLLRLINDILDFSKIEAGKISIESTQYDLIQVIREVIGLLDVLPRLHDKESSNER